MPSSRSPTSTSISPSRPSPSPSHPRRRLREWLELFPDKVLFGTDGYPFSAALGWEESTWIAARNGREAPGVALAGMLHDHEIDCPRAAKIATGVLGDNALILYARP